MNKSFKIVLFVFSVILTNASYGQYSGTYTVGGTNPDFPRLDTAFKWLALKGVSGSVRLNVRSGVYNQRFYIPKIKGSSSSSLIKIAPDPKNTKPVVYEYNIPYTNAYIMEFYQGYVEVDSIEFRALRPKSMAGRMIGFTENCENVTFNGCKFYGIDTNSMSSFNNEYYGIFYKVSNRVVNNLKIINNTFIGGMDGINLQGEPSFYSYGLEIKFNKFYNQYGTQFCMQRYAILLSYECAPVIRGNYINYDRRGSGIAAFTDSSLNITENQVYVKEGECLNISDINGTSTKPNLIMNNIFSSNITEVSYPQSTITFADGYYYQIYNNTIYCNSPDCPDPELKKCARFNFYTGGKKYCVFKNNNLVNNAGGKVIYFEPKTIEGISDMDYNNYYTKGPYLAYADKDILDFNELQKTLGMDVHSINSKIKFNSYTDLKIVSADLDSAGILLAVVTNDIDGNKRDAKKPDIGAYEFDYYKNDIGILKFNPSNFPDCGIDSTGIEVIIKNIGTASQSNFQIRLEIKNDSNFSWSGTLTYTKTIASEHLDTIRFKKFKSINGGRYKFKAITSLNSDQDKSNDTLSFLKILTKLAVKPYQINDTICNNVTTNLGSTFSTNNSYRWYDKNTAGKNISSKSILTFKNLKKDTTFYVVTVTQGSLPSVIKTTPKFEQISCNTGRGGVYFDIIPKTDLSIDSFATYLAKYSEDIAIYFKRGSFSGFENSPKKWARIDSVFVKRINSYQLTNIPLKTVIKLKKDTTYSFYLNYIDPLNNTKSTVSNYSNSDITINLGGGACNYFGKGTNNYPGQIYYTKFMDCESERVPYKVKVKIAPVVNLGRDTSYCSALEDSLTLNAGADYAQYIWNTAQTTQTIKINKAGKFSVKVTNNGCLTVDTIVVNKYIKSKINLGNDTAYCSINGINYNLNPGTGFKSYQWNTGSTSQILNVKSDGIYHVKIIDKNNCEGFDTLIVKKHFNPVVNFGKDTNYCVNAKDTFRLKAGTSYKLYSWSTADIKPQINIVKTGKYSVIVTDSNNCKGGDTITIGINPKPNVNLGNDTTYCGNMGINLTLNAGSGHAFYNWSTSETTSKITVKSAGNYFVEVIGNNKCINSDTIKIKSQTPKVDLGPDRIINPEFPINEVLNAGTGFKTYDWNTLSKVQTIKVTKEGIYFVKVTDSKGCEGIDSITVRYWIKGNAPILENNKILVFPNPSTNILNIVSENSDIERIDVFEITGKSVFASVTNSKDFCINTSQWAKGLYIVVLAIKGDIYKIKVSVDH